MEGTEGWSDIPNFQSSSFLTRQANKRILRKSY